MKSITQNCPSCGGGDVTVFHEIENVPVHSVLLLPTHHKALNYPQGDIRLGFCQSCGFISNLAFDPTLHEYSPAYEATQGFSPTFNTFHRGLAEQLIERYDLHHKRIIEIGCGQGEFLTLLCQLGQNKGIGFDPAYRPPTGNEQSPENLTFIQDFYSERYNTYQADFVCCKMTLEHIHQTAEFVSMVRRALKDQPEAVVFFQVPDVVRILREIAFWDIYYEHCSYFSLGSLARLFRRCGFDILNLSKVYDDQYLLIEAKISETSTSPALELEDDLETLKQDVAYYTLHYPARLARWRGRLEEATHQGRRAVIWGGGSKGVAFLTTLGIRQQIEYAVDINPNKHGTYMAGTGQKIVSPEFLREYKPETVIVMNPIYCREIQQDLDRLGVTATLLPVE